MDGAGLAALQLQTDILQLGDVVLAQGLVLLSCGDSRDRLASSHSVRPVRIARDGGDAPGSTQGDREERAHLSPGCAAVARTSACRHCTRAPHAAGHQAGSSASPGCPAGTPGSGSPGCAGPAGTPPPASCGTGRGKGHCQLPPLEWDPGGNPLGWVLPRAGTGGRLTVRWDQDWICWMSRIRYCQDRRLLMSRCSWCQSTRRCWWVASSLRRGGVSGGTPRQSEETRMVPWSQRRGPGVGGGWLALTCARRPVPPCWGVARGSRRKGRWPRCQRRSAPSTCKAGRC